MDDQNGPWEIIWKFIPVSALTENRTRHLPKQSEAYVLIQLTDITFGVHDKAARTGVQSSKVWCVELRQNIGWQAVPQSGGTATSGIKYNIIWNSSCRSENIIDVKDTEIPCQPQAKL